MKRLYLMRHAEAQRAPGQAATDLFSLADLPLSEKGRAQAAEARDRLARERIDAVYASPAARAQETARIVAAPHGLDVRTDARLWEVRVAAAKATYEEVLQTILDLPHALREGEDPLLPGGESFSQAQRRFAQAIGEIVARHDSALVVAHGLANRMFLAPRLGLPMHELLTIPQEHAEVRVVDLEA